MKDLWSKVKNGFTSFVRRLSRPFTELIRFVFERTLSSYIKNNIDFSNFDVGGLKDLELNEKKLNTQFFAITPFRIRSARIGTLRLNIPSKEVILEEGLMLVAENIEIDFVCNSKINFNNYVAVYECMQKALREMESSARDILKEEGPYQNEEDKKVDSFKLLVK